MQGLVHVAQELDVQQVALSGGEPLLYARLNEVVTWLSSAALPTILTTNGVFATSSRISALRAAGLDSLHVPIHSTDPSVHDGLTERPSWHGAVSAVAVAREIGVPTAVVFVATRNNRGHLRGVVDLCGLLGVRVLIVNRFVAAGYGKRRAQQLRVVDKELAEEILEVFRTAEARSVRLVLGVPLDLDGADLAEFGSVLALRPQERVPQLTVDPSGYVKFCSQAEVGVGHISDGAAIVRWVEEWSADQAVGCYCAQLERRGYRKSATVDNNRVPEI